MTAELSFLAEGQGPPAGPLITAPSINRSRQEAGRSRGKGSSLQSNAREGKLESAREVKYAEIRESKMIAC